MPISFRKRYACLILAITMPTSAWAASSTISQLLGQAASLGGAGAGIMKMIGTVWTGAGATCTSACSLASMTGGNAAQGVCQGAAAVGSADAGSASTSLAGGAAVPAPQDGQGKSSCYASAAMDLLHAATSFSDSGAASSTQQGNSQSQASLASNQGYLNSAATPAQAQGGGSAAGGGQGGGPGAGTTLGTGAVGDACASALSNPTSSAIVQCAVSKDPSLPAFVQNPDFPDQFQKLTGSTLADFAAKDPGDIKQALSNVAGSLPSENAQTVLAALDKIGPAGVKVADIAPYAGAAGAAAKSSDFDFTKNLTPFGSLLGDSTDFSGLRAVVLANRRSPASVTEDRKLSLFDRITYRYHFLGKQLNSDTY